LKPVRGAIQDKEPLQWVKYASANDAARQLNLRSGNISACCKGKWKRTGNDVFEFDLEVVGDEAWRNDSGGFPVKK
jgi:hypothetical protein